MPSHGPSTGIPNASRPRCGSGWERRFFWPTASSRGCALRYDALAVARLIALYVSYGAATLLIVSRMSTPSEKRLTVTTIADQTLLGLALAAGGAIALPLIWVMFWFLIGSGCRYGKRTLAVSCATALIVVMALGDLAAVVARQSSRRDRAGFERAGRIGVFERARRSARQCESRSRASGIDRSAHGSVQPIRARTDRRSRDDRAPKPAATMPPRSF